jgi:hypothetical protein
VDFCLIKNNDAVAELIEAKTGDHDVSRNLKYFCDKYDLKGVQVVKALKRERTVGNIDILDAGSYLKRLFL